VPARCGAGRECRAPVDEGHPVDLFPAIDVRGGNAVRLLRGEFAAETVYDADPVGVARRFEADGARWIHVVDLDAARTGEPVNLGTVAAIAAAVSCRVEVGGGVRSPEAARALLDAGVARVVVGTAAVEHPELVDDLCRSHPGRVAVGLDARGQEVAVRGWVEGSGSDLVELGRRFAASGVAALIVTEIGRDGTLEGPDLTQLERVLGALDLPVVASGGVGTLEDLQALDALEVGGRRLVGAIVGKALYEQRFTVAEGLAVLA
jgi:phosphoribosylformimino-5-aminoimidazole carboxamide ribotide isomerase